MYVKIVFGHPAKRSEISFFIDEELGGLIKVHGLLGMKASIDVIKIDRYEVIRLTRTNGKRDAEFKQRKILEGRCLIAVARPTELYPPRKNSMSAVLVTLLGESLHK